MRKSKINKLEASGWKVGDAADFLELSAEEIAVIDMKISLAKKFQTLRVNSKLTQIQVAKTLHTSQSRIAKMEACDPSVSIDLLIKGLLGLGASKKIVGKTVSAS